MVRPSKSDLDHAFTRIETLAAGRGLPGTMRSTSYRSPAIKVGGRTFIRLRDAATLVLHCPHNQKTLLMEISPDIYFETHNYIGQSAVLVRLNEISDEELSLRIEDAWRFRAPKLLQADHLNSARPTS